MMKLRKPRVTASIRSTGNITCFGATSYEDAKTASRKIARKLKKLGFQARFCNYRVVNTMCTCTFPFGINIIKLVEKHKGLIVYEPELHPGAICKRKEPKATLNIFTSGSINVTAPSVENAQLGIEYIFPLVEEFKTAKPPSSKIKEERRQVAAANKKRRVEFDVDKFLNKKRCVEFDVDKFLNKKRCVEFDVDKFLNKN